MIQADQIERVIDAGTAHVVIDLFVGDPLFQIGTTIQDFGQTYVVKRVLVQETSHTGGRVLATVQLNEPVTQNQRVSYF